MKYPTILFLSIIALLFASGCNDPSKISPEELADASGVSYWTVEVPNDLKDSEILSLVWRTETETKRREFLFQGIGESKKVRSYLWTDKGPDWLKFRVVAERANETRTRIHGKISPPEGFTPVSYAGSGQTLAENDRLITCGNASGDEVYLVLERTKI